MSELYFTAHSRIGMLRFRFEHDSIPIITMMTHLERLHFMRVTGGPANTPIAVSGIRRDDPLLAVMERTTPNPEAQKSDRFLDRRRETTVPTSNQITISVDTTGSEILVGWFEEPAVQEVIPDQMTSRSDDERPHGRRRKIYHRLGR